MKKIFLLFIAYILIMLPCAYAQKTASVKKIYKIGIFSPLYLDSVFNNNALLVNKVFPKFILPGLEFVQGAAIALDTISITDQQVEVRIYDVKSKTEPLTALIGNRKLDSLDLMLGPVKDMDFKILADFALRKNIPFISSVYPNDGGVTSNPFLVIVNSTLRSHCEAIYNFIVQKHGTDKIYIIRKSGASEDRIPDYFKKINSREGPPLLNFVYLNADSLSSNYLIKKLDSNFKNTFIAAGLDETFAKKIADAVFPLQNKYGITLMGMPNWDGFKFLFKKGAYKDLPVHFTTPHFDIANNFQNILSAEYYKRYKSKPTDMAEKGFENAWYFTQLLLKYPNDIMSHLNDSTLTVFHQYNFRPANVANTTSIPHYFENKHLYIMKILNGEISREW